MGNITRGNFKYILCQPSSVPCFLAVGCTNLEQETCYTAHEKHHIYSKTFHEGGKGVLLWFRCSALKQDVYTWADGSHSNHTGNKHVTTHTGSATAIFSFSLRLIHVPAEFRGLWSICHAILFYW